MIFSRYVTSGITGPARSKCCSSTSSLRGIFSDNGWVGNVGRAARTTRRSTESCQVCPSGNSNTRPPASSNSISGTSSRVVTTTPSSGRSASKRLGRGKQLPQFVCARLVHVDAVGSAGRHGRNKPHRPVVPYNQVAGLQPRRHKEPDGPCDGGQCQLQRFQSAESTLIHRDVLANCLLKQQDVRFG